MGLIIKRQCNRTNPAHAHGYWQMTGGFYV